MRTEWDDIWVGRKDKVRVGSLIMWRDGNDHGGPFWMSAGRLVDVIIPHWRVVMCFNRF